MRRVLLVGLADALRRELCAVLGSGFAAESVPRGIDAVRRLKRKAYDVVVANVVDDQKASLEFLSDLRTARPGVREILLGGQKTPEKVLAALRADVFACFGAPHEANDIAAMVARAAEAEDWRDGIEVLSAKRDWVSLRVSCSLIDADRLVHFMRELQADVGGDLLQAFREVLLNAMEHGAGFDPEKVILVSAVRTQTSILYYFRDPGAGFRIDALPHAAVSNPNGEPLGHIATREALGLRPGGFGLLLAKQVADEVLFNERGNEVLLIKRLA